MLTYRGKPVIKLSYSYGLIITFLETWKNGFGVSFQFL